jgi:hypothetical protein
MRSVLWPLWISDSHRDEEAGTYDESSSILLIGRWGSKMTRDGVSSKRFILWPVIYSSSADGQSEWHFPSLVPLFFDKGFARIWGPVLSLAEGYSGGSSSRTSILWRTIHLERQGSTTRWNLSFLVSSVSTPGHRQWGFLGNLLSFEQDIPEGPADTGN